MKKIIILTVSLLMYVLTTSAQTNKNSISVTGQKIVLSGEMVQVSFDVVIDRHAARSGYTLIYRPWFTDGNSRWSLPEIVVQSRRAKIADQRQLWISGKKITLDDARFVRNGDEFHYTASVPVQLWMDGAELVAETIETGCCSTNISAASLLAEVPVFSPKEVVISEPAITLETKHFSTAEQIAESLPWVLPSSEFDHNLPKMMFDDDREAALKVYFSVNSFQFEPYKHGNENILNQLMSVIRKIEESSDSRIAHIVVAGFASPEGSFALNDRLAYNRAATLKEYIKNNSRTDSWQIHIYNGAEDWAGLRMMVDKSNMPYRRQVLNTIDNVPIWDSKNNIGREIVLQQLDGGRIYRYMLQHFFPDLRKAAYIKVFYENNK